MTTRLTGTWSDDPATMLARLGVDLRGSELVNTDTAELIDWEPEFHSGMTLSNFDVQTSKYYALKDLVFFIISATFTTSVAASNTVAFTLPSLPEILYHTFPALVLDGANVMGMGIMEQSESQFVAVARYDFANWGLGAGRGFRMSGIYKQA